MWQRRCQGCRFRKCLRCSQPLVPTFALAAPAHHHQMSLPYGCREDAGLLVSQERPSHQDALMLHRTLPWESVSESRMACLAGLYSRPTPTCITGTRSSPPSFSCRARSMGRCRNSSQMFGQNIWRERASLHTETAFSFTTRRIRVGLIFRDSSVYR